MPLQLAIVSDNKDILGDDCIREFREDGGTIGRSLQNDWILPDPERFISGKHATVDFQAGAYYLADVSTNGVYVNGEDEPLGRGNPRRLFDGDRLRMGDFEFEVSLDEGEGLAMPPPEPMTVVPDHVERLVPEQTFRTGMELLDEDELADDEFQSTLFGDPARKKAEESDKGQADGHANPFAAGPSKAQQAHEFLEKMLDAFMRGLEIKRTDLAGNTDPLQVMENAGRVLKEFVDGSSDLLASRTALKAMFRLDQTTVMASDNNPLKFAKDSRESMMQLLVGNNSEFLSPVEAVQEVFRDLRFHHDAVLEGMISAFTEFVDRFDPAALQDNFDRTLDKKPMFAAMNQLKYWQLYCDLYPIMTQQSTGTFPHQFGEDFVRAYEEHLAEFKAGGVSRDTQRISSVKDDMPVQYDKDNLVDQTEEASYTEF
jgi:predicted component of type VI protein secretion system